MGRQARGGGALPCPKTKGEVWARPPWGAGSAGRAWPADRAGSAGRAGSTGRAWPAGRTAPLRLATLGGACGQESRHLPPRDGAWPVRLLGPTRQRFHLLRGQRLSTSVVVVVQSGAIAKQLHPSPRQLAHHLAPEKALIHRLRAGR